MSQLTEVAPKLTVAYQPKELLDFKAHLDQVIKAALVNNVDYGVIPGTRDGKKVLLKPGAEKLAIAFGLKADYETTDSTIDHNAEVKWQKRQYGKVVNGTSLGLYRYVVRCTLRNHRSDFMGSGAGVCSTLETKYVDRPRDCENTVFKMAQKRAFVAAVLNALGISGLFTQDIGDDEEAEIQQEATQPAPEQGFDPSVKEQIDWLIRTLDKRGVTDVEDQERIAGQLKGTPKGRLYGRIDELIAALSVPKNSGAPTGDNLSNAL